MPNRTLPSRRQALHMLAGMPMLPLAASVSTSWIAAAPAHAAKKAVQVVQARFTGMAAPNLENPAEMAKISVDSHLTLELSDGGSRSFKLAYRPFFVTGDMVPDGKGGTVLAGGYYDIANKPIVDRSVPGKERHFFSNCPDGASLLSVADAKIKGIKGKPVFAVVQFEYLSANQAGVDAYGTLPSSIAVLTLDQDPKTGHLTLVKYHNVDTSKVYGLWITCGASLSPWNTHLSSEEYEPDAFFPEHNKYIGAFSANLYGDPNKANPYHYGHLPEVTVHPDGTGSIRKHFCLGRISHELVQVMPDKRTVLMGDDATNSGLFVFVADRPADLSAGTLYVAKLGKGFSAHLDASGASLSWVKLGHATSAEIESLASRLKPTDIMEVTKTDPQDSSFTKIFNNGIANWIKLKPGMEKAAAFLETHRYAYLMGGSMGFSKMEGTTVNQKDKLAYTALQNMVDSMVKGGKGWNEESGIALDKPIVAGGILEHKLAGGQRDTAGNAIDSEWLPVHTRMLLVGQDMAPDGLGNLANPDYVANPDNLKFSEALRTLFIGEDSGTHVNNFLWAYNVDTKDLSRLLSVPSGGEATGLHAVDELNGWTYILSNFQHAGDWSAKLHGKVKPTLDPLVQANYKEGFGAAVGYLTAEVTGLRLKAG